MNAKEITKILIAYLATQYNEIRIYQEKCISCAICDVMAVTSCLTGYEIKSDLDNYVRLPRQVEAYTTYFDKNYIVIGEKHQRSIETHVPIEWGIILVKEDHISVLREAGINDKVFRRFQLYLLWKLEIKNILMKNHFPKFARKSRMYIIDYILNMVESKTLGEQIAYELMHRDYSVYDAKDYTIYFNNKKEVNEEMKDNFGYKWVRDRLVLDTLPNFQTRIAESLDEKRFTKEEAAGCLEAIRRFCKENYGEEEYKSEDMKIDVVADEECGKDWLKAMIILDTIPGLKMWIDADLNIGKMSEKEAESCRVEVRRLEKMLLEEYD